MEENKVVIRKPTIVVPYIMSDGSEDFKDLDLNELLNSSKVGIL